MNYPVWQLGFPGGLLIAAIAGLHVIVSHFAVGGGAYLVLTERKAYRDDDSELLAYARSHAKFFALLTLVFGALTGVGIWFAIGLVSPDGTSALIHTFVWGWAIEWVFFFVEITAALIYAYQWDRLDRATHLIVGWIYFGAAWASLAIINGILTFMLTPGRWLETHNFFDGVLNPTYFPALAMRTAMAVMLAGMYGLLTATRLRGATRERVARWAGAWVVVGIVFMPVFGAWHYSAFPEFSRQYLAGMLPVARHTVALGISAAAVALVLTALTAVWKPRALNGAVVAVVLVCGFITLGSGEYLREVIRKPWVIGGYLYANGIPAASVKRLTENGIASEAKWLAAPPAADSLAYGREVFVLECGACHSLDGYRAVRPRVRGWDEPFAREMIPHLQLMRGTMPPFAGNDTDRGALAKYLASLNPYTVAVSEANQVEAGREVFEIHCAECHTVHGAMRPLILYGMRPEAIGAMLRVLPAFNSGMPPFTGSSDERRALSRFLQTGQPML
ncbi:MAG TPA: c-type cytochrome [Candidatus Binataceae bacterium]|nr:c-type cytochrome [Candidatus Binataceae bacterium]